MAGSKKEIKAEGVDMPEANQPAAEVNVITFYQQLENGEQKEVGRLDFSTGTCAFTGETDKAAAVFFSQVTGHINNALNTAFRNGRIEAMAELKHAELIASRMAA